jgi:F420-0:gamma-glutamyl ligase-like protein
MENSKKLKAKTIVVTALPPKQVKSYYKIIIRDDFFLISEKLFKLCEEGLVDEVEFEPNGQFTTNATEYNPAKTFNSWKAVNFTESQLGLNEREIKILKSKTNRNSPN